MFSGISFATASVNVSVALTVAEILVPVTNNVLPVTIVCVVACSSMERTDDYR